MARGARADIGPDLVARHDAYACRSLRRGGTADHDAAGLAGTCAAGVCAALIMLAWPSTGQPFAGIVATLFRDGERIGGAALSQRWLR